MQNHKSNSRTWRITKRYLWLSVSDGEVNATVEILVDDSKVQELYLSIPDMEQGQKNVFQAALDADSYAGKKLTIRVKEGKDSLLKSWLEQIHESDKRPEYSCKNRPLLHYTPPFGWMNDPNGLLYENGVFHLYHQHNPYGVIWENIHWSHTDTRDFLHFTRTEPVLMPDEDGPMFSGTGIIDRENVLGIGAGADIFFYTSAGGRSKWAEGKHFTQRLAYSTDQGRTLHKSDKLCMPHVCGENRDPKVFWHEESRAWIMVLYMDENLFYLYRSQDMLDWRKTQEIQVEGMWECPDLFRAWDRESGQSRWIFWSADGYYLTGEFDGYHFTPVGGRKEAYAMCTRDRIRAYAAQTVHNTEDRVIQIAWLTSQNNGAPYTGMFSVPAEAGLLMIDGCAYLTLQPAAEIKAARRKQENYRLEGLKQSIQTDPDTPLEIEFMLPWQETGSVTIEICKSVMTVDFDNREIRMEGRRVPFTGEGLLRKKGMELRILTDRKVLECYTMCGLKYIAAENQSGGLYGGILVSGTESLQGMLTVYELKSITMEE